MASAGIFAATTRGMETSGGSRAAERRAEDLAGVLDVRRLREQRSGREVGGEQACTGQDQSTVRVA
jgi:hypothetical protein